MEPQSSADSIGCAKSPELWPQQSRKIACDDGWMFDQENPIDQINTESAENLVPKQTFTKRDSDVDQDLIPDQLQRVDDFPLH